MKTTEVIIEIFVGGTLMCTAALFVLWSLFPADLNELLHFWTARLTPSLAPLFVAVLGAVTYSVGLIAEFVARVCWEWRLDRIKQQRLGEFVNANRLRLLKSPCLREYSADASAKIPEGAGKRKMGQMRFEIMTLSSELSREVESQISRLRLVRVLPFVELLFLLGAGRYYWRRPSGALVLGCIALLAILVANIGAIDSRFDRYCNNIERAYKILVLDR